MLPTCYQARRQRKPKDRVGNFGSN